MPQTAEAIADRIRAVCAHKISSPESQLGPLLGEVEFVLQVRNLIEGAHEEETQNARHISLL
jgi:hypothetical protein